MNAFRSLVVAAAGFAAMASVSFAGDVTPCPDDYGVQAANYVESRLDNPRGARVQIVSEPYRIAADVGNYSGLEGWGVDIRVRSRLPGGQYGGSMEYTVIFVDGRPVALCDDADELDRV